MGNGISEEQWVGIDLHLHRSVISRIDGAGKQLDCVQIDNDPKALVKEVRKAGRGAPVAIEAEAVKPGETRWVHALCATSSMGSLIQAMVGSFGGWGGRVNRVGFAL